MFSLFPLIRETLHGTAASSLHEARLGREEFGGEVHVYAVAYRDHEFPALLELADHITFNTFSQWRRFKERALARADPPRYGIRVNPGYSEVAVDLYNPCRPGSRFGMRREQFEGEDLSGIGGLHFHTLCEQNADVLERTLAVVERQFGPILARMQWLNMGGGHHISRPDYDVDRLCRVIDRFRQRYDLEVYLEPGEAIALNTGYLVSSVLDIFHNETDIAILDTSATAHMPDVLEMPYRPKIQGAGQPGEHAYDYRLGGLTCLAGDVIGDYSFPAPLEIGQQLVFNDMAHYTMVKNTTFNGVELPAIAIYRPDAGNVSMVRTFGYEDYKSRLS
jgi:carboxynorspermidine decarboxylase